MSRSGAIQKVDALQADNLTSGESTISRLLTRDNTCALISGVMRLAFFSAVRSEAVTQVRAMCGSAAAAAAPTLFRFGLYRVAADGSGVLVASTANDPTLFAAANTEYASPLTAAFNKVGGQRYALGLLCVSAFAMPNAAGVNLVGGSGALAVGFLARAPRVSAAINALADLPANFVVGDLVASAPLLYLELVP